MRMSDVEFSRVMAQMREDARRCNARLREVLGGKNSSSPEETVRQEDLRGRVLRLISERPHTIREIVDSLGIPEQSAKRIMRRLRDRGFAEKCGRVVNPTGRKANIFRSLEK